MLADRVKDITASGIRKVFDLAAKMKNPVNFSIGQPDFDVPEPVKEAAIKAIHQGLNQYTMTQGILLLREKVKEELQKTRKFTPEGLMITNGTSGALLLAMLALVNPGDEVLLPDPYFVMYKHLLSLTGGVARYYSLYPDFEFDIKKIEEKITEKTKIILLNSPSNPTGTVLSEESLTKIAHIAKRHNIIVISDEIYDSFIYDEKHYSIATHYPGTIVLGGFSKSYGKSPFR